MVPHWKMQSSAICPLSQRGLWNPNQVCTKFEKNPHRSKDLQWKTTYRLYPLLLSPQSIDAIHEHIRYTEPKQDIKHSKYMVNSRAWQGKWKPLTIPLTSCHIAIDIPQATIYLCRFWMLPDPTISWSPPSQAIFQKIKCERCIHIEKTHHTSLSVTNLENQLS